MNYTDKQLKQALAKMLPEKVTCKECISEEGEHYCYLVWNIPQCANHGHNLVVLDAELLHLCWLVEEKLTRRELKTMFEYLIEDGCGHGSDCPSYLVTHATWQQRVVALVKVKGIEI